MTEMEEQLRYLMNIAAGDPARRISVEAVRRRVHRRRAVASGVAAAAIVLAGSVGAAVAAGTVGPKPAGGLPVRLPVPAGVPRYYVEAGYAGGRPQVVVRLRATGAITAVVHSPWRGARIWESSIAPADNGVFFISCEKLAGNGSGSGVSESRIYKFSLTRSGQISGYSLVRGGVLNRLATASISATPDGSELAVSVAAGDLGYYFPAPTSIFVINTRTGNRAVWHVAAKVAGTVYFNILDSSLTADGRELVVLGRTRCIKGRTTAGCRAPYGEEVRVFSPAGHGGSLGHGRIVVRQSALMPLSLDFMDDAIISPDGKSVVVPVLGSGSVSGSDFVSVIRVSTTTGKQLRVLYRMPTGNGGSYQFVSIDPSGRYLLFDAGPSGGTNGWINRGRLVPLKPSGGSVSYEAW